MKTGARAEKQGDPVLAVVVTDGDFCHFMLLRFWET